MKRKGNEGFSLIEVLVSMAILGAVVVPICASLVLSFRINAKTDDMMQAQLAVSSAVETLMAEGITTDFLCSLEDLETKTEENGEEGAAQSGPVVQRSDRFPNVKIIVIRAEDASGNALPYYNVTVFDNEELVTVTTTIRMDTTEDANTGVEEGEEEQVS